MPGFGSCSGTRYNSNANAPSIQWIDSVSVGIGGFEVRAEATLRSRGYEALGWIVYSLSKGYKRSWATTKAEEVGERVWLRTICSADDRAVRSEDIRIGIRRTDPACGRRPCEMQRLPVVPEGIFDEVEDAAEVVDVLLLLVWAVR